MKRWWLDKRVQVNVKLLCAAGMLLVSWLCVSVAMAQQQEVASQSPRQTLLDEFFPAMNAISRGEGDTEAAWSRALATMQWDGVAHREGARQAARDLLEVFDKIGKIEVDVVPDAAALNGMRRYVFFPNPARDGWMWEELRPFERWPVGQIVLVRDEAGWKFSQETVAGAAALAESLKPLAPRYAAPQTEQEEKDLSGQMVGMLGPTFSQTPWWGWLILLGAIFLGLAAGKIFAVSLRKQAEGLAQRGWTARSLLLEDAANPVSLALLALGLSFGLEAIALTGELSTFRWQVLQFLFLVALGWFLYNLVNLIDVTLKRLADTTDNRIDNMIVPLVRKALRIFLVVMFTLVVAQNIFGLNITGWLAGLGIAGLAISLAAQDSVKNLFGSLTVFFDKPFKVGDFINYGGQSGIVEEIGFRSTRLRLLSGHLVTIPNMKWIDNEVENIAARKSIRRDLDVTITYDTPAEKIEEALQIVRDMLNDSQVVEQGRFDLEKQPPRVYFNDFNAASLNIRMTFWYQLAGDPDRNWFTFLAFSEMINKRLFSAYGEAGIDFAFPTQTLHLAGDPKRQLAVQLLTEPPATDA